MPRLNLVRLEDRDVPATTITFSNSIPSNETVYLAMYGNDEKGGPTEYFALDPATGNVTLTSLSGLSQVPNITFSQIPLVNGVPTINLGDQWIDSARIYFSVGSPINVPTTSSTTVTNPGPLVSGYQNQTYDWIEFTQDNNDAIFINTSQVDMFGLPIQMTISPAGGNPSPKVGILDPRDSVLSAFTTFMGNAPASAQTAFSNLVQNDASSNPIRILNPTDALTLGLANPALNSYFDAYIDAFWDMYDRSIAGQSNVTLSLPGVNGANGPVAMSGWVQTIQQTNVLGQTQTYRVLQMTDPSSNIYNVYEPFFSTNNVASTQTGNAVATSASTTGAAGLNNLTVDATTAGLVTVGMLAVGTNIPTNAIVVGVSGTQITLNTNTQGPVNGSVSFFNSQYPAPPALSTSVLAATGTSGQNTITVVGSTAGIVNGTLVYGPGIGINNVVTGVNGQVITLAAPNSAAVSGNVSFANQSILTNNLTLLPSNMVVAGNGVFADNTYQFPTNSDASTLLGSLENLIATAFNRGIATNTNVSSDWYYTAQDSLAGQANPFYNDANTQNPNHTWNYYGEFFHQFTVSNNGLSYALSFDDQGGFSTTLSNPTSSTNPTVVNVSLLPIAESSTIAVGAGTGGGPHVKTFDASGNENLSFFAYSPLLRTGVHVAMGDVNADGIEDVLTAPAAGGGPHIRVFDGNSGAELYGFFAYAPEFTGGVYLASGDMNRDGYDDIICSPGPGGGPQIKVYDGKTGALIQNYFAYDPSFRGGLTVAAGDFNGDTYDDLVTGPGPGGGPQITVFNGIDGKSLFSFFGFAPTQFAGVYVAAGDVDDDGTTEIVVGSDTGATSQVNVFDFGNTTPVTSTPFGSGFTGGVRVGATDDKLVSGAGPGGGPVFQYGGASYLAFDPNFRGGIYVAG